MLGACNIIRPEEELGSKETISTRAGFDSAQKVTILIVSDVANIAGLSRVLWRGQRSVCRTPVSNEPLLGGAANLYMHRPMCASEVHNWRTRSSGFTDGVALFIIKSSSVAKDDGFTSPFSAPVYCCRNLQRREERAR